MAIALEKFGGEVDYVAFVKLYGAAVYFAAREASRGSCRISATSVPPRHREGQTRPSGHCRSAADTSWGDLVAEPKCFVILGMSLSFGNFAKLCCRSVQLINQ
jgi:hypothetical protein